MATGRASMERIVAAASTAPSAENCQPWSFRSDGERLLVLHDAARARHALDRRRHASYLTLGCLLEALEIAATAEGSIAQVRTSLGEPQGSTWAEARFEATGAGPHELVEALPLRATDRRLYQGGSASAPVFDAIREDARRFSRARVHVRGPASDELLGYVAAADGFAWRHREVYLDILRWVRFTREEVERTRDGAPVRSIGFDLPALPGMRLSRSSLAHGVIDRLGLFHLSRAWVRRQVASSAALILLTVPAAGSEALVDVGRLALSLWLRLNQAGYGVQPLSLSSLSVYDAEVGGLPAGTRPEYLALFGGARALLARAFGHPGDELPVWMFRTGLSTPLPDDLRTRRLPIEAIFTSTGDQTS